MERYLVSFDTDRIKEYLFATPVLSDIREASGLLDRLNTELLDIVEKIYPSFDRTDNEQCIFAAGGGAMVILPEEAMAAKAIAEVEKHYKQNTVAASITGEKIGITEEEMRVSFGGKAHQLGHRLRKRKAEKGRNRVLSVAPYMHFCDVCAQYPAISRDPDEEEFICRACRIKRTSITDARRRLRGKLIPEGLNGEKLQIWQKPPKDFSAIGTSSRRQGYLALIYADGNSVGSILGSLRTPLEYAEFSASVDITLKKATYDALAKHVEARPTDDLFEILMLGGDDLMLVTSADIAVQVTLDLMRDFEKFTTPPVQENGLPHLSLGTGIVIAQDTFPIVAMVELATALQKEAKRRSFEIGGSGAVDFMVVTSAGSEALKRIRGEVLTEKGFAFPPHSESPAYRLTQRPYSISEMDDLLMHGKAIRQEGFPQSQLQALYDSLFHSPVQASLSVLQTMGRVRPGQSQALQDFFNRFGPKSGLQFPPWRAGKCWDSQKNTEVPCRDTALGDLIEIYPFI